MKLVETSVGSLYIGSKDDVLDMMEQPKEIKFDIIWNLAEELGFLAEDEQPYSLITMLGNIPDYDTPDLVLFSLQLMLVGAALMHDKKVLIHCFAGHGRTGLALAAIKITLDKMTAEQAIAFAKEQCNGPETPEQEDFVRSLEV
jgi:protein-tyrosine phosphatase